MGTYTQARGWLNVDSVGEYGKERYYKICNVLNKAQNDFCNDETLLDVCNERLERKFVCRDTIVHRGFNGCVFLFFGTELKNYGNPAYCWVKYLLDYFPNAEGRIDFCCEDDEGETRYLLISKGKIVKDDYAEKWTVGYGNKYK